MEENATVITGLALAVICICGAMALDFANDQAMAKSNLQQCLVRGHVLWQKECAPVNVNEQ